LRCSSARTALEALRNALYKFSIDLLTYLRNVRWLAFRPLVNHGEYADGTDRQTDGRQTNTLRFPLHTASVILFQRVMPRDYSVCRLSTSVEIRTTNGWRRQMTWSLTVITDLTEDSRK